MSSEPALNRAGEATDQTLKALARGIENSLHRLACDIVLCAPEDAPDVVRGRLPEVARLFEDAAAALSGGAAITVREIAAPPDASAAAPCFDQDEIRREEAQAAEGAAALGSDPEMAAIFVAEALDHLGSIEALVLRLEETPDDLQLLNDVFRPFHTVKGNSAALGLETLRDVAHVVENLLDRARSGRHRMGREEIDIVLKSVDLLTTMINDMQARMNGGSGRIFLPERRALENVIDRLVARGDGGEKVAPAVTAAPEAAALTPAPEAAAAVCAAAAPKAATDPAPTPPPVHDGPRRRADDAPNQTAVKVDMVKLDNLVNMVGELVIVQSIIQEDPVLLGTASEHLTRHLGQLRRITADLQHTAMSMRMVAIRGTFQKMARIVRDLSRTFDKPVELIMSGEETELDRHVVEDLSDPLVHMIRNSIDHGLEPAAQRIAAGKPARGRLVLKAYHEAGDVVIEISDDGGGLDTERIRARAIAQGVIGPDDALTAAETNMLIFHPGLSTAEKVTEISGRGVGMDVVRRNIEQLRGRIEIRTAPGHGTTFLVRLPLTLAIIEGIVLRAGGERFIMPTFAVRESLKPKPEQVQYVQGRPRLLLVRDALLPLASLADLLNLPGDAADPAASTTVIVESGRRPVALMVDQLLGKQEVVIKSLGQAFRHLKGVSGGAILGDGRIGLILDAGGLVDLMVERAA